MGGAVGGKEVASEVVSHWSGGAAARTPKVDLHGLHISVLNVFAM